MKTLTKLIIFGIFFGAQVATADMRKHSWTLASHIYQDPGSYQVNQQRSLANYAMPSGCATYFVTSLKPGNQYSIGGKLPNDKNILFSSITLYDKQGNIVIKDGQKQAWNMKTKPVFKDFKLSSSTNESFLIQRVYRENGNDDLSIFSPYSDNHYLLKIDKFDNPMPQAPIGEVKKKTKVVFERILSPKLDAEKRALPSQSQKNRPFKIPTQTSGLFVNSYAIYAIATPSNSVEYVKISGQMPTHAEAAEKEIVFTSFMAVDYQTTETLASISSKELGGFNHQKYVFYVAKDKEAAGRLKRRYSNAKILYWTGGTNPGVVFRILSTEEPSKSDFAALKPDIKYYDSKGKPVQ